MTGINQTMTFAGSKGISARVTAWENYDPAANTSDLQLAVEVISSRYGGHIYYLSGVLAVEGAALQSMSAFAGSHYVYVEKTGAYYPIAAGDDDHTGSPWTRSAIAHESDGSKTVTISLQLTGEEANGRGADGWEVSGTWDLELTHIPRASTLAATDAVVGAVSMVAVSRKSTAYTHSVQYRFGSLSGYLTADGISQQEVKLRSSSLAFRIPESFYTQIPNAKSGKCTLSCKTYAGSAQVGGIQSCTFTVSCDPALCAPAVTAAVVDVSPVTLALTGSEDVLVRYASSALCTIQAEAKFSAQLAEKRINGKIVSGNTLTIQGVEKNTIDFSAKDSRGFTTAVAVKKTMIPYIRLTCNPVVKRTDPTSGNAVLTVGGDCFAGSFGAAQNALTLRYRIDGGPWKSLTAETDENRYTAQADLTGLHYLSSFQVEVQAADRVMEVSKTLVLGKGIPVFDWGETDFAFHVPVRLAGMPQAGADAVCKAYADEKLSVVKLWENPDPGAEFPAQTVEADLSGCAFVFCASLTKTGTAEYQISAIVPNGTGNAGSVHSIHKEGTAYWLSGRKFTLRYNGIQFGNGWARDMANDTVYENERLRSVPVAIYGFRGMQT